MFLVLMGLAFKTERVMNKSTPAIIISANVELETIKDAI